MTPLTPLISSVAAALIPQGTKEPRFREIADALRVFVAAADRLPSEWKTPDPTSYRRQRLYEAPDGTFSIGCFVWSPGQASPIHDHLAWGVIGVAAGRLVEKSYSLTPQGELTDTGELRLDTGQTAWCGAGSGHIHRIGSADSLALSIHIYGSRFDKVCGRVYPGGAA